VEYLKVPFQTWGEGAVSNERKLTAVNAGCFLACSFSPSKRKQKNKKKNKKNKQSRAIPILQFHPPDPAARRPSTNLYDIYHY
jgi:hypothetical protein